MNEVEKEQLRMEIQHVFDSGANEIRIFEMVKSFIESRNGINKLPIHDVVGRLEIKEMKLSPKDFCKQTICAVNSWNTKCLDNKTITEIRDESSHKDWWRGKDAIIFFAKEMIVNKCDEDYFREILITINE